ncbi:hypothetical protein EG327_009551 [Venturia inaequalis]|uniref:GH16 domain-containing protein n=1 Tax=Venturia inaequalis TaxID=5025 RepID=A0A8H3ZAI0_VENIN|nr:hypothetical protein EG327_009551 [Venturia inaequalis]
MPFKDSLGKLMGKLDDKLNTFQNTNSPPQIPFGSKPQSDTSSNSPYWKADFSPACPVSTNFKHELGDGGWGNNELENYTSDPTNSFHTERHELVLRAIIASNQPDNKSRYTSARLTSHQLLDRRRGYIEATLTAPSARGIWPAFWLLPQEPFRWPEDGEVDIMESWNAETMNHACMHWGHFNGEDSQKHRVAETSMSNIRATHVYGFAWEQPEHGGGGRFMILQSKVQAGIAKNFENDGDHQIANRQTGKLLSNPQTRREIRDMIWSLTASYHTIQDVFDYNDYDHFPLRIGIDYMLSEDPAMELHLVTPAILLVN